MKALLLKLLQATLNDEVRAQALLIAKCLAFFDEESQSQLVALMAFDPALQARVLTSSLAPDRDGLALLLSSFADSVWERGARVEALTAARLSDRLRPDNLSACMTLAEMHMQLEDRCAHGWAAKVLNYDMDAAGERMRSIYSSPDLVELNKDMRKRAVEIINTCHAHPEWRDTSTWLQQES